MTITYKLLGNCPIIGTPLNSILKKETVGAVAEARTRGGAFARTFGA